MSHVDKFLTYSQTYRVAAETAIETGTETVKGTGTGAIERTTATGTEIVSAVSAVGAARGERTIVGGIARTAEQGPCKGARNRDQVGTELHSCIIESLGNCKLSGIKHQYAHKEACKCAMTLGRE
jgi:hypothetical protein